MAILSAITEVQSYLMLSDTTWSSVGGWFTLMWPIAENAVKEYVGYQIEQATFTEFHPDLGRPRVIEDELIDGWEMIAGRAVPRGPRGQKMQNVIQLKQLPVREIIGVYENPAAWDTNPPVFGDSYLLTEGHHYRVDWSDDDTTLGVICKTGHLVRRVGIWQTVGRSVKAVYKAGYTRAELDTFLPVFKLAVFQTLAHHFREAKLLRGDGTGIIVGETLDGWSQSFAAPPKLALGTVLHLPPSVMKLLEPYVRMHKYFGTVG